MTGSLRKTRLSLGAAMVFGLTFAGTPPGVDVREPGHSPANVANAPAVVAKALNVVPALLPDHPSNPTVPARDTLPDNDASPNTVTFTAAIGTTSGAGTGPGDCLGPNCSSFYLFVQTPGTSHVRVRIDWTLASNDYDMYIFKQNGTEEQVASSGNGATTFEEAIFVPEPNTLYQVLIVHFASAADNINGSASLIAPTAVVLASRVFTPGIVFSPNGNIIFPTNQEAPTGFGTTRAPETTRDGEPSIRSDVLGNVYPAGIRGVPAGVDVWRFGPGAFCPRFKFHYDDEFPTGLHPRDPDGIDSDGAGPAQPVSNPFLRGYVWLGQPDGPPDPVSGQGTPFFPAPGEGSPDAGGGDIELAVSFPTTPGFGGGQTVPALSAVSLTLANITANVSFDRGNNWGEPAGVALPTCSLLNVCVTLVPNPVGATVPLDDRQWIEAHGPNTVYLYYRTLATLTGLILNKSIDNGLNYATSTNLVNPLGLTPGWIDVSPVPGPVIPPFTGPSADIYLSAQNSTELRVFHCVDPNPGALSVIDCDPPGTTEGPGVIVDNTMTHGVVFDPVSVGTNGNVYVAWSNNKDIFYAFSIDKGQTFSSAVKITNAQAVTGTDNDPDVNIMPWIVAGTNERIGIAWYGSTNSTNVSNELGEWRAYYAFVSSAKTAPSAQWTVASDHVLHVGCVSLLGLQTAAACETNRNLIDFFEVAVDPRDGAAVIAYADDHNDFDGATYYARQIQGPPLLDTKPTLARNCTPIGINRNPEVDDQFGDATVGIDTELPDPNLDLRHLEYTWVRVPEPSGPTYLQVDIILTTVPPTGLVPFRSYRAYFAINTARGLMDLGNEYFLEATTETGLLQFFLGATDRSPDGTTSEQRIPMATENITGDQVASPVVPGTPGRIRIRVLASRLDYLFDADSNPNTEGNQPLLTANASPPPSTNELVIGLRGRARIATPIATSVVDETRGGSFIILNAPNDGGCPGLPAGVCPTTQSTPASASQVTSFGGWHPMTTFQGKEYHRFVGPQPAGLGQAPFLEFRFPGNRTAVRYDYFLNPRGGVVEVFLDGVSRGTINQFQAGTDQTGELVLNFASRTYNVAARPANQLHTLKLVARTNLMTPARNIVYVSGFNVNGGAVGKPAFQESVIQLSEAHLAKGETIEHTIVADALTKRVSAVVGPQNPSILAGDPVKIELFNPAGSLLATSAQVFGPETVSALVSTVPGPGLSPPGIFKVRVTNRSNRAFQYAASFVRTQQVP